MSKPAADLRLPVFAAGAWASALASVTLPSGFRWALMVGALALTVGCVLCGHWLPGAVSRTIAALGVLWLAVSMSSALRAETVHESWVAAMAKQTASGQAMIKIRGDPKVRPGVDEDRATVRAEVLSLDARGKTSTAQVSVMMVMPAPDAQVLEYGASYQVSARLTPSTFPDTAAVLVAQSRPVRVRGPSVVDSLAVQVRDAVQAASSGQTDAAGLVPALVDGDERALPSGVRADFRTAGLSHLLAVSGTNFVLLGSAWLALVRRCGVRGRGLVVAGMMGIIALTVVARAEPSVVRAAVMGGVALIGLSNGQRGQAGRALGACVCLVMLFQPTLASSPGFALSVLATAGILLWATCWRDTLAQWMPRVLAEGIAVSLAAYLACLPVIVALSGQVSLVAVPANLAAGVVVAPATVLGFLGGAVGLVLPLAGRVIAAPATWCASWIVGVAHHAARVRQPELATGSGTAAMVGLVVVCLLLAGSLGWVLQRPLWAVPLLSASLVPSLVPLPAGSWPPPGWIAAACDVGQGDGLLVRLAEHRAMVIDAGPDPNAMRLCLKDMRIRQVPIVVLTHFHADHVNGLEGVLDTAQVGAIEVTDFAQPQPRAAFVHKAADAAQVPIRTAVTGEQTTDGEVTWQVLAPLEPPSTESDSPPNDASVVLLVRVRGVRILFMGDEETGSQTVLDRTYPEMSADVLKVAHHGSAKQDFDLISRIGARHAIISAGRGNQYGLPKASTLMALEQAGMQVHRTDRDGALAVVVDGVGSVRIVARGP